MAIRCRPTARSPGGSAASPGSPFDLAHLSAKPLLLDKDFRQPFRPLTSALSGSFLEVKGAHQKGRHFGSRYHPRRTVQGRTY
jgi:hypothetical protein